MGAGAKVFVQIDNGQILQVPVQAQKAILTADPEPAPACVGQRPDDAAVLRVVGFEQVGGLGHAADAVVIGANPHAPQIAGRQRDDSVRADALAHAAAAAVVFHDAGGGVIDENAV